MFPFTPHTTLRPDDVRAVSSLTERRKSPGNSREISQIHLSQAIEDRLVLSINLQFDAWAMEPVPPAVPCRCDRSQGCISLRGRKHSPWNERFLGIKKRAVPRIGGND
jgi:hypothetical protein